jgi:hypothetical protein
LKIRRIIVGLGPAPQGPLVLEAAAALAARLEVELMGLFVESVSLLNFAGLPFAREVGIASAAPREVDRRAMERALRALAQEAHQRLAHVAARSSVRWSFRVARGHPATALITMAEESDLVIARVAQPEPLAGLERVRLVRAGDSDALRAALEEGAGRILVLAGTDDALLRETLRGLLEQGEP